MTTSRLEVANTLKSAGIKYYAQKLYGVFTELGLSRRGSLRADVVAVNRKGEVIILEVKSCQQDLKTDKKMAGYLEYSNKAYLVVSDTHWGAHADFIKSYIPKGMGVLVVAAAKNRLVFAVKAETRKMDGAVKKDMVLRMAWRSATYSARTLTRRQMHGKENIL